ncbi:MAG: hypothetical protein J0626_00505, partial [Rhodospirillaceae bacterium]|nr:hypothetical protein [Rhodospirillaceae bacterium]
MVTSGRNDTIRLAPGAGRVAPSLAVAYVSLPPGWFVDWNGRTQQALEETGFVGGYVAPLLGGFDLLQQLREIAGRRAAHRVAAFDHRAALIAGGIQLLAQIGRAFQHAVNGVVLSAGQFAGQVPGQQFLGILQI